jgi:16S rRNA (cytidine1402-2'-O)-methyltransferase
LSELRSVIGGKVRGEVTLVIEGAGEENGDEAGPEDIADRLRSLIDDGVPKKEAIARVAAEFDRAKRDVYAVAVEEGL